MSDIINPFQQAKKTDWAKKAQQRLVKSREVKEESKPVKQSLPEKKKKKVERVAKSFKIFPGKISRDFDKRVNKMQVHFDDLDYEKNYVDSGKYMMFLMAFAEKYELYDLYTEVSADCEFELDENRLKEFLEKIG